MSQKERVVNVHWACRDISAPDRDVYALPDCFCSPLLEALHTRMCSCLSCNSTSSPLAFLSAVPRKSVPSVLSEQRALTKTRTQLEFRPEVGCFTEHIKSPRHGCGRDSRWQSSHSFHFDTVHSASWGDTASSLLHFSGLHESSSLFHFLTDLLCCLF